MSKNKVKEIEVNDKMVVAAAMDINTVLAPNPLLDLEKPGEELQKEIEELFPNIMEGDALTKETWTTLIALGWKAAEAPKIEKPKASKPEKVAKEPKAAKVPKVPKESKGPGVIATIVEVLKKGKPVTKEAILAILVKRFPDRSAESMGKTINVQVPNRIAKEQKIKVEKTDKGYVIR